MTKFNQSLIDKARKGEIAILNDGSVEELREVLTAVWPDDTCSKNASGKPKVYHASRSMRGHWDTDTPHGFEKRSVKDFIMQDTKDAQQPRTYKVTRQQMKEIWEACHDDVRLMSLMGSWFTAWDNETDIGESRLNEIRRCFNQVAPDILKKHFPAYFFIPEGEPVLRREYEHMPWKIGVSDGKGGVYSVSGISGSSDPWKFIIPFTKNPPK